MKYIHYFIIGVLIWFAAIWLPQLIKAWILEMHYRRKKKHAKGDDAWTYKI